MKTGNIVIIVDDNGNRNEWSMGKVVECIKSKDGRVRSAKILIGNRNQPVNSKKYLHRPVSKLVTLIEN